MTIIGWVVFTVAIVWLTTDPDADTSKATVSIILITLGALVGSIGPFLAIGGACGGRSAPSGRSGPGRPGRATCSEGRRPARRVGPGPVASAAASTSPADPPTHRAPNSVE